MKNNLPKKIILTAKDSGFEMSDELSELFCEEVNNYLAEKYGFLNEGFSYQIDLNDIMWEVD